MSTGGDGEKKRDSREEQLKAMQDRVDKQLADTRSVVEGYLGSQNTRVEPQAKVGIFGRILKAVGLKKG